MYCSFRNSNMRCSIKAMSVLCVHVCVGVTVCNNAADKMYINMKSLLHPARCGRECVSASGKLPSGGKHMKRSTSTRAAHQLVAIRNLKWWDTFSFTVKCYSRCGTINTLWERTNVADVSTNSDGPPNLLRTNLIQGLKDGQDTYGYLDEPTTV